MWKLIKKTFKTGKMNIPMQKQTEQNMEIAGAEKLKKRIRNVFGSSLHIRHLDSGSCNGCDFELTTLNNVFYDIQQYGIDFVASPRHADILVVTGGVTRHLERAVHETYQATPDPKVVIAIGDCACHGGEIGCHYATIGGVEKVLPVDVYVLGCPPSPEEIIQGIFKSIDCFEQKIIEQKSVTG